MNLPARARAIVGWSPGAQPSDIAVPGWLDLLLDGPDIVAVVGAIPAEAHQAARRLGGVLIPWDGLPPLPAGATSVVFAGSFAPRMRAARQQLRSTGGAVRVAILADNLHSPIRMLDAARGCGGVGRSLPLNFVARVAATEGWLVRREYGLLRSWWSSRVGFALDAPVSAEAALRQTWLTAQKGRRRGIRLLRRAAIGGSARHIVPAVLTVLERADRALAQAPVVTGRFSSPAGDQASVLFGEPPSVLERRYTTRDASAEAEALEALAVTGLVPQVLARPAEDRVRVSWLQGGALPLSTLSGDEIEYWTTAAAQVLRRLHDHTRTGPQVLLHDDFWLGNVLVEGAEVTGVVDWTESRWGPPADDLRTLVSTMLKVRPDLAAHRSRLEAAAVAGYRSAR